ncbi:hypothetical protein AAFF_G00414500 [Aldrovandia affinis]|uniref:Protein kinase domain-containing protein n=1 Tax=Aldrovandia affinis TaxID=143900 RepID=A0AAD7WJ91_9TELE|nr:hypothetical protein AAFF_G00414500 [Aldrovandia affinis]
MSTHIQRDLYELVAKMVFKQIQPILEEKAEQIQSDPEGKHATPHHDLEECPLGISLESFVLHKVLGRGSFGKVMLAELKESGELFAIKVLNKSSVLTNGYTHYAMIEKRVMKLAVENPFLAHLHSTFQTKDNLFFVMEYIKGGSLFYHIEEKGRFDLVTTRFYAAELTCGLQFLHRNGVIYRDLKLDNVMLDQDGHIKIVDFGLCRDNMFGRQRANSFCGSEHYIAPEIYQKRTYTFPVDWWSFGVLLFEMLTGDAPFYGADYDELYRSVCWDSPLYPSWIDTELKDLLIKEGDNDCSFVSNEVLDEAPKLSQGDSSSTGPMDQSAFADFAFINSKWCSAQ